MTSALSNLTRPRLVAHPELAHLEVHGFAGGLAAVFTSRAPGKTTHNEDCAALVPFGNEEGVLVVADGVGGLPTGDAASRLAISELIKAIDRAGRAGRAMRDAVLDGIETANRAILEFGIGGATTLALVTLRGRLARPYHVGDSMVLLTGQRGRLKFQSVSHSPVGYAVESGMLDEDEAVHHEERHVVSNVIGAEQMRIEIGPQLSLAPRDTLVVATDGLADNLYVDEIVSRVRKGHLSTLADQLARDCRARMESENGDHPSHPDDLTFIVYRPAPPPRTR